MPATVSYRSLSLSSIGRSSYSFTGVDIGPWTPDRYVVVGVGSIANGASSLAITALTVGGVAATVLRSQTDGNASTSFAALTISSGSTTSTATIDVTVNSCASRMGISVWAVYGVSSTTPSTSNGTSASPGTFALNVTLGSVGAAIAYNNQGGTATWTGVTEDFDDGSLGVVITGGSYLASAAASRTITVTYSTAILRQSMVSAVWAAQSNFIDEPASKQPPYFPATEMVGY